GLVAILDADKEGFLRSETSLIQTMGRAARNVEGKVIMYADEITDSMRRAMDETDRRRRKQTAYNEEHGIEPRTIQKAVLELIRAREAVRDEAERTLPAGIEGELSAADLDALIAALGDEMKSAAPELEFERAAELRDEIEMLREKSGREG
ncbi:MAG TPA: UvrB/UvrC motif-containing protein, partial [Armatimonadota bacterium]|nr:UvrB/UvrC motif-containing protein [Armatimonadota bacterium]